MAPRTTSRGGLAPGRGAVLYLDNSGIGPAIVQHVVVKVDGRPPRGWREVLTRLLGHEPAHLSNTTVLNHGLRGGDRVTLLDIPNEALPRPFWTVIGRVGVSVCYASVFDEHWLLTVPQVGQVLHWRSVDSCPAQPPAASF